MKKVVFAFIGTLMILGITLFSRGVIEEEPIGQRSSFSVICSQDLYNLASGWVGEYLKSNPGPDIKVYTVADADAANMERSGNRIGFFAGDQLSGTGSGRLWKMSVGRDITVPVMNPANPFIGQLNEKGVTAGRLATILSDPAQRNWGFLAGDGFSRPISIYLSSNEEIIGSILRFTGLISIPEGMINCDSPEEVALAVKNNPGSIGFCQLINISGENAGSFTAGIQPLPIDKNENGRIDYMENIFDRPDNFARGVWIGKYPRALYTDIYCVASSEPKDRFEVAFLKWVLINGQAYLGANGLSELVMSEKQSKLDAFNVITPVPEDSNANSFPVVLIIFVAVIIFLSVIMGRAVFLRKARSGKSREMTVGDPIYFSKQSVQLPKGLYYDKSHTWTYMEKDGLVKVGIDDFLQHVTGPVTRVEMRKAGEKIRKGDMLLSIVQNGKRLVVFAPVSGVIKESNSMLDGNYSLVNSSPYGDGWIYRIEPVNWPREIQLLEMAEKYQEWLHKEFMRLKDFLAGSLKVNKMEYDLIVLQDGGMLKDGVLAEFGPEVWEDFQTHFLDTAE